MLERAKETLGLELYTLTQVQTDARTHAHAHTHTHMRTRTQLNQTTLEDVFLNIAANNPTDDDHMPHTALSRMASCDDVVSPDGAKEGETPL